MLKLNRNLEKEKYVKIKFIKRLEERIMFKKIVDKNLFYQRFFLLVCDILIILSASILGLLFRFDFEIKNISTVYLESVLGYLPINIIITIGIFGV